MRHLLLVFLLWGVIVSPAQKKLLLKTWEVLEMKGLCLQNDSVSLPILKLENGKVNGNTSCNRLMGEYELRKNKLIFKNLGGTKMFCSELSNLREQSLFATLKEVKFWKIKKTKLYFFDEYSSCVMILKEKK